MIPLSPPLIFLVPLAFTLLLLFATAVYYAIWRSGPPHEPTRTRIYRCAYCRHVYVVPHDVPLACCPRCDSMNEAVKL